MNIKRFTLTLVLAVVSTLAAVGALTATAPAQAKAARPGYTPPPIAWGECAIPRLQREGGQCGELVVPLDYSHPNGTKIKIAVSRILHKVPDSQYQGVMLVNPGGPGGSGLIYAIFGDFVPDGAGDAYDWIGFDPRGVGSSEPALSCVPTYALGPREPYRPANRRVDPAWLDNAKAYADACRTSDGSELLDHLRTADSAADMDSLRIALGQQQINYYGFSYGTYLGQVYATMYPNRVRRFIFDGTVNPERVFYRSNQDQDVAFQKTFDIYFDWLAKYQDIYNVGATRAEVRQKYLASIAALDAHPADGVFGGDELTDVFTQAGYYVYGWVDIAQAYSAYINDGDASGLEDIYGQPDDDNGYAIYLGVQCTDAPWPHNQQRLNQDNWRLDRNYDYLTWGNGWFNGPCAYWPGKAGEPVHVDGRNVHSKILMIGETYDAATPFSGSLVVRQLFPTASLIEGVGGTTHAGSLSGVACSDDAITQYLVDGSVPKRLAGKRSDLLCPPVPPPTPEQALARTATAPGVRTPELRQELAVTR
jgi:pimeloyl-ACP methyl ester carboxylesterase